MGRLEISMNGMTTDAVISRPVYGLIFLFRWMEEDPDKQEQSCPEGVWFANQVSLGKEV